MGYLAEMGAVEMVALALSCQDDVLIQTINCLKRADGPGRTMSNKTNVKDVIVPVNYCCRCYSSIAPSGSTVDPYRDS